MWMLYSPLPTLPTPNTPTPPAAALSFFYFVSLFSIEGGVNTSCSLDIRLLSATKYFQVLIEAKDN